MDISANQSNQVAEAEMADIDQFRPATKSHVEPGSLQTTEDVREEMADEDEHWDDIYGADAQEAERASKPSAVEHQVGSAAVLPLATEPVASDIRTETDEDVNMTAYEAPGTLPLSAPGEHQEPEAKPTVSDHPMDDDLTAKMADAGGDDELVDESKTQITGVDEPSSRMIQETSELEQSAGASADPTGPLQYQPPDIRIYAEADTLVKAEPQTDADADAEFAAAAKAQEGNPEAEFGWDSSSDDSSSDSSSSDDSSDEDVEPMDAETLGKILMAEDGGDGDGKSGANHQPRTQNEVEIIFPKPDLTITRDMKITTLGKIEHFVGNVAVIVGNSSAYDQVMEIESVLCNDERQVIGVIQDAMCKVDEPRYIVAFTSPEEFQTLGLEVGSNVHYVNDHAKSVFTQGLRGKGTDASNIHDEEVAEDEMDFSDDEMEAEFKRKNKESKKAGRGALTRGQFNRGEHKQYEQHRPEGSGRGGRGGRGRGRGGADGHTYARGAPGANAGTPYDRPQKSFPSMLDYGDDVKAESGIKAEHDDDDMYTPLKRPDNMAQMQYGGPSGPKPQRRLSSGGDGGRGRGGSERGRGRGRGRGEGGRGRGDKQGQGRGDFKNHQQSGKQPQQPANVVGGAPHTQSMPAFQPPMPQAQPQAQAQAAPQAQQPYQFNFGQAQQPFAQPQAPQQQQYQQQYQQQFQQQYQQQYQQPNAYPQYPQMQQQQPVQAQQPFPQVPQAQPQAQAATAEQWAQYCQQNPAAIQQMLQHLQTHQPGGPQ